MGVGQDDDNWKVGCTATGEGKFNACSCLRAEPFQQHMRATDCLDVSHVYGFSRSPRNSAVCSGDCVVMFLPSAGEEISAALHRSRGISIGARLSPRRYFHLLVLLSLAVAAVGGLLGVRISQHLHS